MIKTIEWKKDTTNFIGRNGYFKCKGVELMEVSTGILMVSPITSKGDIGRCCIDIPTSEIPALIENLIAFTK